MKRHWKLLLILALILTAGLLTGCAPGDEQFIEAPAGFLTGIWHGIISLITLIISFFSDNVHMYETNNVGWSYDLGFLIGVSIMAGGGGFGGGCRGRRSRD